MIDSVSLIVPSVNGGPGLIELVRRLLAETTIAVEVVVADNGLASETAECLERAGARVAGMGANLGFGRAVNRAALETEGQALAVVNDDIKPDVGFVDELVRPLLQGSETAAGVLLFERTPEIVETAGIEVDAALNPYDYMRGERADRLPGIREPPLGPCGGAAAFMRSAFSAAGGFDEGFFAYLEDADLAIRLRALGASCQLARNARAIHHRSSTLGYRSLAKARLVGESRGYFIRKYGLLGRPLPCAWILTTELGTSAVLARRHRSLTPARARVHGWRRGRHAEIELSPGMATVGLVEGLSRRYRRSLDPSAVVHAPGLS